MFISSKPAKVEIRYSCLLILIFEKFKDIGTKMFKNNFDTVSLQQSGQNHSVKLYNGRIMIDQTDFDFLYIMRDELVKMIQDLLKKKMDKSSVTIHKYYLSAIRWFRFEILSDQNLGSVLQILFFVFDDLRTSATTVSIVHE